MLKAVFERLENIVFEKEKKRYILDGSIISKFLANCSLTILPFGYISYEVISQLKKLLKLSFESTH